MVGILRWHISRKYEVEYDAEGKGKIKTPNYIDVAITPAAECLQDRKLEELASESSDNLEWWNDDEDEQLDGRATEEELITAITKKNIFSGCCQGIGSLEKDRKIEEDMVFLQIVDNTNLLEKKWDKLINKPGLHDVSDLTHIGSAKWVDYTAQARKMSAAMYQQVLGEGKEEESAKE